MKILYELSWLWETLGIAIAAAVRNFPAALTNPRQNGIIVHITKVREVQYVHI